MTTKLKEVEARYGRIIALTDRPVPKLKRHKLGMACVYFKVRGRRIWRYFGPWGSQSARAKYHAFTRAWPSQLDEPSKPGKWPAARMLTHEGRTMRLSAWAKETGLRAGTIAYRLDVLKWSIHKALTTPIWGRVYQPRNRE